ncbi:MAG: hypothetical protein OQJ89_13445, partial [Kangiellaceae bacterium]|nr:hypothetical protein [Kangiellaceae bacterium]
MLISRYAQALAKFFITFFFLIFGVSKVYATPPTFTSVFSPDNIGPGSESSLVYTITNVDNFVINDVAFTNTLPANVNLASPVSAETTCANAVLTAADGGTSVTLSDVSMASNSSCTVTVRVTSNTAGTHTNTTGDLTSDQGNSGSATDDLTVSTDRPGYTMAFSPTSVNQGEVSTLTLTFDNSLNASNVFNLSTSVSFSSGLVVAGFPNASSTCTGGTITAGSGSSTVSYTFAFSGDASVSAGATCTVSVDVLASGIGNLVAQSDSLTAFSGFSSIASGGAGASLTASQAFGVIALENNPSSPGASTNLNVTLNNFDRSNNATNITFTDDLDAALSGMVATGLPLSNVCGSGSSVTTSNGGASFTFAGGTISPESSCSFSIPVSIPGGAAIGSYTNTTSSISLDLGGSGTTRNAISHKFSLTQAPTVLLDFTTASVVGGGTATVDFTITNTDAANAASDITLRANVSDMLSGVTINSLPAGNSCGAGSTFTQTVDFDDFIFLVSSANLAAGASCNFSLGVTLPTGAPSGTATLTTSDFSATVGGSSFTGVNGSDTINVVDGPSLNLSFPNNSVEPGETVTATFTLEHDINAPTDATGIGFTLDLDSVLTGLAATGLPASNVCGAGSSISGTGLLTFSSGTLAAGSSCTFDVDLVIPAGANPGSYSLVSSTVA